MLTPGPALARRIRLARPGWRGMGFRGLGQDTSGGCDFAGNCYDIYGNQTVSAGSSTSSQPCGVVPLPPCPGGTTVPSTNTPSSQSGNVDWTKIIQSAIQGTATAVAIQTNPFAPKNIPAGTYYASGKGGTVISTAGAGSPYTTYTAAGLTTAGLSSMLPVLLIGGVFMMFMMGRR